MHARKPSAPIPNDRKHSQTFVCLALKTLRSILVYCTNLPRLTTSESRNLALEQLQWALKHGAYRRHHHDRRMAAGRGLPLSMMVIHLLLLVCCLADAAAVQGSSVRVSDDLELQRALAQPQVGTASAALG